MTTMTQLKMNPPEILVIVVDSHYNYFLYDRNHELQYMINVSVSDESFDVLASLLQ